MAAKVYKAVVYISVDVLEGDLNVPELEAVMRTCESDVMLDLTDDACIDHGVCIQGASVLWNTLKEDK